MIFDQAGVAAVLEHADKCAGLLQSWPLPGGWLRWKPEQQQAMARIVQLHDLDLSGWPVFHAGRLRGACEIWGGPVLKAVLKAGFGGDRRSPDAGAGLLRQRQKRQCSYKS